MESSQSSSEVLRKEILEQSQNEVAAILNQAEKEKTRILQEAREEAEKIHSQAMRKAQKEADVVQRRILSGVHLEIKQESLRQREKLIGQLLSAVEEKFEEFRASENYIQFLEKIILEGLIALDVRQVVIQAGDVEKRLLQKQALDSIQTRFKKRYSKDVHLTVGDEILSEAGVILEDDQKRLKFDNRFSARIHRMQNELRLTILKELESNKS